jgi:hypothetical protein
VQMTADLTAAGKPETCSPGSWPGIIEVMNDRETLDEILGIVRCARCGHRLNGEIECPFCSLFPDPPRNAALPKWVYITACFLTSPLSLYFILTTRRLTVYEKILAFSGCIFWSCIFALLYMGI